MFTAFSVLILYHFRGWVASWPRGPPLAVCTSASCPQWPLEPFPSSRPQLTFACCISTQIHPSSGLVFGTDVVVRSHDLALE